MADERSEESEVEKVRLAEVGGRRVGVISPPGRWRPTPGNVRINESTLPQEQLFPNDSPHHV